MKDQELSHKEYISDLKFHVTEEDQCAKHCQKPSIYQVLQWNSKIYSTPS